MHRIAVVKIKYLRRCVRRSSMIVVRGRASVDEGSELGKLGINSHGLPRAGLLN